MEHYPLIRFKAVNHDKDHIHFLVSIPPAITVGKVIGIVKQNTSPSINCGSDTEVTLRFYRYAGVEGAPWDYLYVSVYDGSSWNQIWSSGGYFDDSSWVLQEFDVSAYADGNSDFRIRFGIYNDDIILTYMGWNIDDVVLTGSHAAVGGEVYPVNKVALLVPWIAITAAILGILGVTLAVRRRRIQN